jgi:hypothetical protein
MPPCGGGRQVRKEGFGALYQVHEAAAAAESEG